MKKLVWLFLAMLIVSGFQFYNLMSLEKDWSTNKTMIEISPSLTKSEKAEKLKEWTIEQNSLSLHKSFYLASFIISTILFLTTCLILGIRKEKDSLAQN